MRRISAAVADQALLVQPLFDDALELSVILPLIDSARGFLEAREFLVPVAFVGNLTTRQTVPVMMSSKSDEAKDESAATIKRAAAITEADFVFIVMEAWSLRPDKLHRLDEILDNYGSIGNSPYAIDVVSMSLETRYGIWVAQLPIRPKGHSKKIPSFGQPEFRFFDEAKGRLVDLLPTKDDGAQALHWSIRAVIGCGRPAPGPIGFRCSSERDEGAASAEFLNFRIFQI